MPQLDCDYVKESDEVIYANLTDDEKDDYLNELYGYLKDKKFEHLGTRGEIASSLSGAFTTYYLEPATELSDFSIYENEYKFVYSDGKIGMSSEGDDFTGIRINIGIAILISFVKTGFFVIIENGGFVVVAEMDGDIGGRFTIQGDLLSKFQTIGGLFLTFGEVTLIGQTL